MEEIKTPVLLPTTVVPSRKPRRKGFSMPIITKEQLKDIILLSNAPPKFKALAAFIYLTGARVSEIVPNKLRKWRGITLGQLINGTDLIVESVGDKTFWVLQNIPVEKIRDRNPFTKRKNIKGIKFRNIPINLESSFDFTEIVTNWIESEFDEVNRKPTPNTVLFPYTRQWVQYNLNHFMGIFPHYLRHLRLTHLVQDYGISDAHLQLITGWDSTTTAMHYRHLNWRDVAKLI